MVGRPQRKVFCQGNTRAGLRKGLKIPCRMKGYPLSDGKTFRCKYHGYQNYDKFNKAKYTDESRIKQLKTSFSLRIIHMNKSKNTITPKQNQELITEKNLSIIEEKLIDGMTLSEIINDKQYPFSLMKFYIT